jgi:hypothetical protein
MIVTEVSIFRRGKDEPITLLVPDGYFPPAPFNGAWAVVDLSGVSYQFNWDTIEYVVAKRTESRV